MSAICRVPNALSVARQVGVVQNHRLFTQQMMNDDGVSSRGGYNRFRGRGRYESHRGGRSTRPRASQDEYRYWLHAKRKPPHDHEKFVIASYNILADQNVQTHWRELYWHIPPFIMDWDARKRKLIRELGLWAPDIVCLQEVDRYEDMQEGLQESGYVGVYTARTGQTRDGCAMFWRKNRFELLEQESIYFKDHDLRDNVAQLCVLQINSNPRKPSENGNTEPTTSGSQSNRVVVGNIHVLFNPKRGDVKIGQIRVLFEKAHAISQKWGNAPVAIAGDFNSTPGSALYKFISSAQLDLACHDRRDVSGQEGEGAINETNGSSNKAPKRERYDTASGSQGDGSQVEAEREAREEPSLDPETSIVSLEVIDTEEKLLVTSGEGDLATEIIQQKTSRVSLEAVDTPNRIRGWYQDELLAATGGKNLSVVQHKLNLRSAYSEIEGKPGTRDEKGEPFVTTFHKRFRGTVDYIWHTDDLCTVRVLDTLPTSVLEQCRGLPSKKWGSDHLALACEFAFVPRETESESG